MIHTGHFRHSPFFLGIQIKAVIRLKIILWQKNKGSCKEIWTRKSRLNIFKFEDSSDTKPQLTFYSCHLWGPLLKLQMCRACIHFIYHQWGNQKEHTSSLYTAKTGTFLMQLLCCSNLVAKQSCSSIYSWTVFIPDARGWEHEFYLSPDEVHSFTVSLPTIFQWMNQDILNIVFQE